MILALSGRIKAGKSTVANIIQLLIGRDKLQHEHSDTIFENMLNPNYINSYSKEELEGMSNWKQVAFAAKLKQIVALLIGCTVEQLEDREFKEKELGEEWNTTKYSIIDSDDAILFSSFYKNDVENELDYYNDYHYRTVEIIKTKVSLTPRLLLQLLGTECGREIIHPNIWVNSLMADYKCDINLGFDVKWDSPLLENYVYKDFNGKEYVAKYPNWIITDVRFPNELQVIKERNGIVIRINRNNIDASSTHESETALDNTEFDYVIDNNSDIPHLIEEVRKMLIHFKIL